MDSANRRLDETKLLEAIDDAFQSLPDDYDIKIVIRAGHVGVWMEDDIGYQWPVPVSSSIGEAVWKAIDLAFKQAAEFGGGGGE